MFNPKHSRRGGGGGGEEGRIHPQAGSSLLCAETESSMKLKLCDFYHMLISFHSEYKPVPCNIDSCMAMLFLKSALYNFG